MPDTPRFLKALKNEPTDAVPVWFMRQAGRYMPEYRALRQKHTLLEIVKTPELAAEVTLQPLEAFDVDAAIIFSDLLPPLEGMGLPLRFATGEGPVIDLPVRSPKDVDRLGTPPAAECLSFTLDAIRLLKGEMASRNLPLIGFAGAPFTLASYAIEGGSTRKFHLTKTFMYQEPAAWRRLMEKLVTVSADFLQEQVRAGAHVVQVFDSWVGALSRADYLRYVQPYTADLLQRVGKAGVPVIHFTTGTGAYLDAVAAAGGHALGVDVHLPIAEARQKAGAMAVQGNLDPLLLLAPWRELKAQTDDVIASNGGKPGFVFNTGHGLIPQTPPDAVRRLVDYIHQSTSTPLSA